MHRTSKAVVLGLSAILCMGATQCLPQWGVYDEISPGVFAISLQANDIWMYVEPVSETSRVGCATPLTEQQVRDYSTFNLYAPVMGQEAHGDPLHASIRPFIGGPPWWPDRPAWSDVTYVPFTTQSGDPQWLFEWDTGWFLPQFAGCAGDPATSCYPTWVRMQHHALAFDQFTAIWALTGGQTCTMEWSGFLVTASAVCFIPGHKCFTPLDPVAR